MERRRDQATTMRRSNDDEDKKSTISRATRLAKGVSCVY